MPNKGLLINGLEKMKISDTNPSMAFRMLNHQGPHTVYMKALPNMKMNSVGSKSTFADDASSSIGSKLES